MTTFTVTRWCCTSGLCIDCHNRGNHGNKDKRQRVIQCDNLSKDKAEKVVSGWQSYGAEMQADR